MFLAYINDLPDNLTSQTRLFADDCLVYHTISGDDDVDVLQNDLNLLETWQDDWLMNFNPSKCCTISFATSNPPKRQYKFCGVQLSSEESTPYLGVELQNTLSWNKHTRNTASKAQKVLGVIRRNMWSCSEKVKSTAYTHLVRPKLEYGCAAWDPHNECNIKALDRVQRQAARFCKRNYIREDGVVTKLLELQWEDLALRRQQQRLSVLYKMQNQLIDIPVTAHLTRNPRDATRGHYQKFVEIRAKKDNYKYSFFPRTVPEWNKLSKEVVNSSDIDTFKDNLKTHYLGKKDSHHSRN